MTYPANTDPKDQIEDFAGTAWKCSIVESLLENAEIKVYVCGEEGTMAPWDSGGGLPINRIMIAGGDYGKARMVIDQYFDAMKNPTPGERGWITYSALQNFNNPTEIELQEFTTYDFLLNEQYVNGYSSLSDYYFSR